MSYLWYWPSGGWDFDRWKARHLWNPVHSSQSDRTDFAPLIRRGGSLDEWRASREEWLRISDELLGTIEDAPPGEMRWETLETREAETHSLRRIRYLLTESEWGYAWLLIPHDIVRPAPAAIALHQTVPQGKDEPVGLDGDPNLAYGKELAERGFLVLAPDAIGFGERRSGEPTALYHSADQFFDAHPNGSVMRKMAYDANRAVDLLEAMPETMGSRIGCIGHSHGGYGTLFAMIDEPRIQAGVVSCGLTTFRADPTPNRWWRNTALVPRLGFYEDRIERTPLDAHHWLALIAPRSLLVSAALQDDCFPNTDVMPEILNRVRSVYRIEGAAGNLHRYVFNGGHSFPKSARERAYRMLRDALA